MIFFRYLFHKKQAIDQKMKCFGINKEKVEMVIRTNFLGALTIVPKAGVLFKCTPYTKQEASSMGLENKDIEAWYNFCKHCAK